MPLYNPSFVAGGDIFPASFVTVTGEFTVSQVSLNTEPIIGVAQEGTFDPPNLATLLGGTESKLAAKLGRTLKVFGLGDVCMVRSSGNITAGSKVRTYTGGTAGNATLNGGAITIGTTAGIYQVGGTALNTVLAGEKVLIQVNPHVVEVV